MRFAGICSEVARNISCNWLRVVSMVGALAILIVALTMVNAITTVALVTEAAKFRSAGGSTLILAADKAVNPSSCDALSQAGSVQAAGAMRASSQRITFTALPSNPVPTFEVSPSFLHLLDMPATGEAGVFISQSLAADLSVGVGDSIRTTTGIAVIGGVYSFPDDGRRADIEYAVLVPVADSSPFDECWISTWPVTSSDRSLLLQSIDVNATLNTPADIHQLNSTLGTEFNGNTRYVARLSSWFPMAALFTGFLVAVGAIYLRRIELASARHSGVSRGSLIAVVALEFVIYWLVVASIGIASVIPFVAGLNRGDATSIVSTTLSIVELGAVGIVVGTVGAVALIQESQLFRFFKSR